MSAAVRTSPIYEPLSILSNILVDWAQLQMSAVRPVAAVRKAALRAKAMSVPLYSSMQCPAWLTEGL